MRARDNQEQISSRKLLFATSEEIGGGLKRLVVRSDRAGSYLVRVNAVVLHKDKDAVLELRRGKACRAAELMEGVLSFVDETVEYFLRKTI
eukprot:4867411-Pyramimonas_sp.AAC.2